MQSLESVVVSSFPSSPSPAASGVPHWQIAAVEAHASKQDTVTTIRRASSVQDCTYIFTTGTCSEVTCTHTHNRKKKVTLRVSAVSVARTAVVSGSDGKFGPKQLLSSSSASQRMPPTTPKRGACNNANAQGPLLLLRRSYSLAGRVYRAYTPGLADR